MAAIAKPMTSPGVGRTLLVGLLAGLTAGIANIVVLFVTSALFNLSYLIPMGGPGSEPVPLPLPALIITCVLPALAAALYYWALGRFTNRATPIFVGSAVVALLLMSAPPLLMPIDFGTVLGLEFMHLVAGAIITYGLVRFAPQR